LVYLSYGHLVYLIVLWYILWPFGLYYGHFVHLMAFGSNSPGLVCCAKNNLATLSETTNIPEEVRHVSSTLFLQLLISGNFLRQQQQISKSGQSAKTILKFLYPS
jgi:hypothetical protein